MTEPKGDSALDRILGKSLAEKADRLAQAKRDASDRGKQPFDLDELEQLYDTSNQGGFVPPRADRERDYEFRYYVSCPEAMNLAEYAKAQAAIDTQRPPKPLTDPAELAMRADVLLERTPVSLGGTPPLRVVQARRDLEQAIGYLAQVLALIPDGAERVPDDAFDSFTTKRWSRLHPERYTRADLTASIAAERRRLALLD